MRPLLSGRTSQFLATTVALLLFWIAFNLFRGYHGASRIDSSRLSSQHALFAGPKRHDNSIDYAAAVDRIQGKNVPEDQNFLITVLELLPPDNSHNDQLRQALANEFSFDLNSKVRLQSNSRLKKIAKNAVDIIEDVTLQDFVGDTAKAAQVKLILEAQNPALDRLLTELERRPRLFVPLKAEGEDVALLNNRLTVSRQHHEFARWLLVRSNLSLANREAEKAWRDIYAVFQLSNRVSQGASVLDAMIGFELHQAAAKQTFLLLNFPWLDRELVTQMSAQWKALPANPNWSRTLDIGERATILDLYDRYASGEEVLTQLSPELAAVAARYPIGWIDSHRFAEQLNVEIDALVVAARKPDAMEARREVGKLERSLHREPVIVEEVFSAAKKVIVGIPPKTEVTRQALETVLGLLVADLNSLMDQHIRYLTQSRLNHIAIGARVFESENGRLPANLSQLADQLKDANVTNPFTGKEFELKLLAPDARASPDNATASLVIFAPKAPEHFGQIYLAPLKLDSKQ